MVPRELIKEERRRLRRPCVVKWLRPLIQGLLKFGAMEKLPDLSAISTIV
jgi:hypothetical protein